MERKSQNENLFFLCEGICLRNDTEFIQELQTAIYPMKPMPVSGAFQVRSS